MERSVTISILGETLSFHSVDTKRKKAPPPSGFEPLPDAVTHLVLQDPPRMSNPVGQITELFETNMRFWGRHMQSDSSVLFDAYAASGSGTDRQRKFAVKMILHAETVLASEVGSACRDTFRRFLDDAKFHARYIQSFKDRLVPTHYGLWRAESSWGGTIYCSIMSWGGVPWTKLVGSKHDTSANRMLIGRTIEAIHDLGIEHRQFRYETHLRHILLDTTRKPERCLVVDFSLARIGLSCPRKLPVLQLDTNPHGRVIGCSEAACVMWMLGMLQGPTGASQLNFGFADVHPGPMADVPETSQTHKALEFCRLYRQRFPDVALQHVLRVQRQLFFPDATPILPGGKISYTKEGKVVLWKLRKDEGLWMSDRDVPLEDLCDTLPEGFVETLFAQSDTHETYDFLSSAMLKY